MIDILFNRRSFLRIGSISSSMTALGLSDASIASVKNDRMKSVVWLWLGGGPTQFETFHAPTENVPIEWMPVNGNIYDSKTNINLGADWENLAKHTSKFTTINSFTHNDSSHRHGTHFMMTGHFSADRAETGNTKYPSFGSIVSSYYGANNPSNGVPTYIRQGSIDGDEAAWLGGAFKPFDPSNKENLSPRVDVSRFSDRRNLLNSLNTKNLAGNNPESTDFYKNQAYDVILGSAKRAFDLKSESDATRSLYGSARANDIGEQMILARRLVENGSRFVTIHYGGWDMHGDISKGLKDRVPPVDKAIAGFLQDVWDRGLNNDVLLVITGEFGRTKINVGAGRDHWPAITPMLIAGGRYLSGRTIGAADRSYTPTEQPYGPIDLQATLFDHFNIDGKTQRIDNSGRPRYLLDGQGRIIL